MLTFIQTNILCIQYFFKRLDFAKFNFSKTLTEVNKTFFLENVENDISIYLDPDNLFKEFYYDMAKHLSKAYDNHKLNLNNSFFKSK